MNPIENAVAALAAPAAYLAIACALALAAWLIVQGWERLTARQQTKAWNRSTRGNGWQPDTAASQFLDGITALELIDDALPDHLVHQLEALYVRQEETQ